MTTTSQTNFRALVQDADEKFDEERQRPVVYRFSNNREFKDRPNPYGTSTS